MEQRTPKSERNMVKKFKKEYIKMTFGYRDIPAFLTTIHNNLVNYGGNPFRIQALKELRLEYSLGATRQFNSPFLGTTSFDPASPSGDYSGTTTVYLTGAVSVKIGD